MEQIEMECPFCKGREFVIGYQISQGCIHALKDERISGAKASKIKHYVCKNCYSIVRSVVEYPEIFDAE
ncbi:MAG: hypothetical protein E7256_02235 [Lachnospiraceae bacterium]|nr:hypothetical protein [Lachnospiraceae bacterium]